MALEAGGYSDKLGNRYEGRWVVHQLLRLLREEIRSVGVELVGDDEHGVDLWIEERDGSRHAQQCKIRNRDLNHWRLSDLSRHDLLKTAFLQLERDPTNAYSLVSPLPFVTLHDLCESARRSTGDPESFYIHQVQAIGANRRILFKELCEKLALDPESHFERRRVFEFLRRFFVELHPDTRTSEESLKTLAGFMVDGNPATTIAVLADFAQDHLREALTVQRIWRHLADCGLCPRSLDKDDRVLPAVLDRQAAFKNVLVARCGLDVPVLRPEAGLVLEKLYGAPVILVHGKSGHGKSGVLLQLCELLEGQGIAYLPISLEAQQLAGNPKAFGLACGLPEAPSKCLDALAGNGRAVLILDQLDTIRSSSPESAPAFALCSALVDDILALRRTGRMISAVLACRTYDAEHDPMIASWMRFLSTEECGLERVLVGPYSDDTVESVAVSLGVDLSRYTLRQKALLKSPNILDKWARLPKSQGEVTFNTTSEILSQYIEACLADAARRGLPLQSSMEILTNIVDYADSRSVTEVPVSAVGSSSVRPLVSAGLLELSGRVVRFCHQSILEHLVADKVVSDVLLQRLAVAAWVGTQKKQTLVRREHLRQIMVRLAIDDPGAFLANATSLLSADGIRFHMKQLVLEVIGQHDEPDQHLHQYLLALLGDPSWKPHVEATVYHAHPVYVSWLIRSGMVTNWLLSDSCRPMATSLLRSCAGDLSTETADVLRPFLDQGGDWPQRILDCMHWIPSSDGEAMFELRLEVARRGMFADYVDWKSLGTERGARLLEAIISTLDTDDLSDRTSVRLRMRDWMVDQSDELLAFAINDPLESWRLFMPHLCRLLPRDDPHHWERHRWIDDGSGLRTTAIDILPHLIYEIIRLSGAALAARDGAGYWEMTEDLRTSPHPVADHLLVDTYASCTAECFDDVLEWLIARPELLHVGTGRREAKWMPARRLLERMTPSCSDETFFRIEGCIAGYHAATELHDARIVLKYWKDGDYCYYWGEAQYFLLPGLSATRRRRTTDDLIKLLARRYHGWPEQRFLRGSYSIGGTVVSPVSRNRDRLSDRAWCGIISGRTLQPDGGGYWKQLDPDHVAESSARCFATDLRRAAARQPHRFGMLALALPTTIAPCFKEAIVSGMGRKTPAEDAGRTGDAAWSPAHPALVEQVILHFGKDRDESYAMAVCSLLETRSDEEWSPSVLSFLIEYARHQRNDHGDNQENAGMATEVASAERLETNGLNCVAGHALHAIGALVSNHPALLDYYRESINSAVEDADPVVRVAALRAILPILWIDRDLAVRHFCALAQADMRIAACRAATTFFNCGFPDHRDSLEPIVRAMMASEMEDVSCHGAREVAARWVFFGFFEVELEACLSGRTSQRKGAAQVAEHLMGQEKHQDRCVVILRRLKNDVDAEVIQPLRSILRSSDALESFRQTGILLELIESEVFRSSPFLLIYGMKDYQGKLVPFASVLLRMCRSIEEMMTKSDRERRSRLWSELQLLVHIMLRLYQEADECGETSVVCGVLDAIDSLYVHRLISSKEFDAIAC